MIKLTKGERINISERAPGIKKIAFGLGWDDLAESQDEGGDADIDVSVFLVAPDGKIPTDKYFVFYNNLKSPDGCVVHSGDNRTGEGEGDDEVVYVNLDLADEKVKEIIFIVTIHADPRTNYISKFGEADNVLLRIYDPDDQTEIMRYVVDDAHADANGVEAGKLIREGEQWIFLAEAESTDGSMEYFVDKYA